MRGIVRVGASRLGAVRERNLMRICAACGRKPWKSQSPTIGQQLIDLQKAKDSGAITDTEYQAQKAKLLAHH
jgi:hypothetical protein